MAEIIAAIDETAANTLIDTAIAQIQPQSANGSGNLGPFVASYAVSATLSGADVDLIAPDIIRIANLRINWSATLGIGIDLSSILPDFCLPRICVNIPCVGRVCTPRICIDWPTIGVSVPLSDFVEADADFRLAITLSTGIWNVEGVVAGVPSLRFGPTTALLLVAIGAAVTPILLAIPFLGPLLAIAVNTILALIGVAGLIGLLGPILTPFVSGLRIPIYKQAQLFEVLPIEGPIDPAVHIMIDAITASVQQSDEDELVLTADISPA